MKKLVVLLMITFFASPCMAYENFIMMTDHEISNIKVSNEEIITVEPIVSLKCENRAMMIVSHNVGRARLSFCKGKKHINLLVKVSEDKTCIRCANGVKFIPVDLPPELR